MQNFLPIYLPTHAHANVCYLDHMAIMSKKKHQTNRNALKQYGAALTLLNVDRSSCVMVHLVSRRSPLNPSCVKPQNVKFELDAFLLGSHH